jgi:hypothetical protein
MKAGASQVKRSLKIAISIGAILLAGAHVVFPSIAIDATTLILLFLALVPWILPFVKSIDIPGVGTINLADTKAATDKITKTETPATRSIDTGVAEPSIGTTVGETDLTNLWSVFETDPNLALVGFRIEIEKRIRQIAEKAGIDDSRKSLARVARELLAKEVLPHEVVSGVIEIVALGNQAAHGATVEQNAAQWVLDVGPSILVRLDQYK